jgi:hypothetical protein
MKTLVVAWCAYLAALNMKLKLKAAWALSIALLLAASIASGFYFGTAYQREVFRSQSLSITAYLHQIDGCAGLFFFEFPERDQVSYGELVDTMKYMPRKQPLLGEDYDSIFISRYIDHISVIIPGTHLSVTRNVSFRNVGR